MPVAMRSEGLPKVMGLETELGIALHTPIGYRDLERIEIEPLIDAIRDEHGAGVPRHIGSNYRRFLPTGDCVYIDVGDHPELVTRECRTPTQVVAADAALRAAAVRAANSLPLESGTRLALFVNSRDIASNSYGCHENYLCSADLSGDVFASALVPHLVTRIIYTGSGFVDPSNSRGFQISQRAEFLRQVSASGASHNANNRPFVDTRNESLSGKVAHRRLHVSAGETNLLQTPTLLKFGTTAILASMIEAGWRPDSVLSIARPTDAIARLSHDVSLTEPIVDSKLSALDIQQLLLEDARAWAMTGRIDPFGDSAELERVLARWRDVLDALTTDPDRAIGSVDWVTRRAFLDAYSSRYGLTEASVELRFLSLQLDELPAPGSISEKFLRWNRVAHVVDPADVAAAWQSPGVRTRADARGNALRLLGPRVGYADWEHIRIYLGGALHSVSLSDPLDHDAHGLGRADSEADALAACAHLMIAEAEDLIERDEEPERAHELAAGAGKILGRTDTTVSLILRVRDRWPGRTGTSGLRAESIPLRGILETRSRDIGR